MYTQTEKVNIEPKSYLPVFRVSQNDIGRTLKAHLISDDGEITIPTSATVTMAGIKPSGLGYTVTGTIAGSDVTFETNATMTDEAGQIESEIRIVDGETLIGTTNVVLNVEPNPHPDDVTDGQREPLVNEITALLNQITAQADRVEEYSSKVLNMTVSAHESQEPTVTKTEDEVVNLDFGLPRGEKGERGERGERGEAGKDGKDGLDGKDGKDGINGVTPDFSIGTVTTLEPTESASVTLTGTEEEPVLNFGIPKGAKGEQGDVSLSDLEKIMVTDTASGAIASFPDGSDLLPALSLVANIVPKQSGSGTPSPENIRPISGWESVEVVQASRNLFNGSYDVMYKLPEPIPKGTWVTASAKTSGTTQIFYYDIDGSYIDYYTLNATDPTDSSRRYRTFRISPYESQPIPYYIRFTTATATDMQFELSSENALPTPYEAPTTHTTSLGRTVYGGTVDVVSGTLTVDKLLLNKAVADMNNSDSYPGWTGVTELENIEGVTIGENGTISDVNGNFGTVFGYNTTGANRIVYLPNSAYRMTQTQWQTNFPNDYVQFVVPLAEPQTYTLTPQTINTLAGVNNVWADSGDCSITYYADTKLYIDKKLGGN